MKKKFSTEINQNNMFMFGMVYIYICYSYTQIKTSENREEKLLLQSK